MRPGFGGGVQPGCGPAAPGGGGGGGLFPGGGGGGVFPLGDAHGLVSLMRFPSTVRVLQDHPVGEPHGIMLSHSTTVIDNLSRRE